MSVYIYITQTHTHTYIYIYIYMYIYKAKRVVVLMTAAKFNRLLLPVMSFALSNVAKISIFVI